MEWVNIGKRDNNKMKNDVNMGRSKNEYRKIKMKENGVNWKRLKSVVLKHPNESRLKYDE